MSEDDDPPAYMRAHLAKRRLSADGVDGGAVAAGIAVTLAIVSVAVVFPLGPALTGGIVLVGLIVGGFATGKACNLAVRPSAMHGAGAALGVLGIIGLIHTAAVVADSDAGAGFSDIMGIDPLSGGLTGTILILISAIAAVIGAAGRNQ